MSDRFPPNETPMMPMPPERWEIEAATKRPWRVFTSPDGIKVVGIGTLVGGGICDAGFGVWAWNAPEGIANANLIVEAVNSHDALAKALEEIADLGENGATAARLSNIARLALEAIRAGKP